MNFHKTHPEQPKTEASNNRAEGISKGNPSAASPY